MKIQTKVLASNKKNIFIVLIVVLAVIIFIGVWNYLIFKRGPAAPGGVGVGLELSPEVLQSLTPPPGAEPAELSPEVLKSLTPPLGAEPAELSPEVLRSLTP